MSILTERDRAAVRKEFEKLTGPVKLVVFSQELLAGDLCRQNEALVREVAELSDKITVEILNLALDRDRAAKYGVDQVPAIVVEGAHANHVISLPNLVTNDSVQFEVAAPYKDILAAKHQAATHPRPR